MSNLSRGESVRPFSRGLDFCYNQDVVTTFYISCTFANVSDIDALPLL